MTIKRTDIERFYKKVIKTVNKLNKEADDMLKKVKKEKNNVSKKT